MLPMIVPKPACAAAIWPHAIVAGTIHTIRRDHEPPASIREQQPSVTAVHASDPENGSAATSDDSVTASASASPPQHAANRGSPSLRRNHQQCKPCGERLEDQHRAHRMGRREHREQHHRLGVPQRDCASAANGAPDIRLFCHSGRCPAWSDRPRYVQSGIHRVRASPLGILPSTVRHIDTSTAAVIRIGPAASSAQACAIPADSDPTYERAMAPSARNGAVR